MRSGFIVASRVVGSDQSFNEDVHKQGLHPQKKPHLFGGALKSQNFSAGHLVRMRLGHFCSALRTASFEVPTRLTVSVSFSGVTPNFCDQYRTSYGSWVLISDRSGSPRLRLSSMISLSLILPVGVIRGTRATRVFDGFCATVWQHDIICSRWTDFLAVLKGFGLPELRV